MLCILGYGVGGSLHRCTYRGYGVFLQREFVGQEAKLLILNLISGVDWRVDDYSIKIGSIPDLMRGLSQE